MLWCLILLILDTVVRELNGRCIGLRNNLLLSGSIMDQQKSTIVSGTLPVPRYTTENFQESLRCQLAMVPVGLDKKVNDQRQRTNTLLMGFLVATVIVFLGFLVVHFVG